MAKGNLFLGFARKKLGDVVFYRANGEQISRARNRNPKNPKSAKQAVQRMVLATAAKMASAFEPIVNHSWEGIQVGAYSVQHFRSLAMNRLREAAAYALNEGGAIGADFAIKGAPIVGIVDGLPISRGSLSFNRYYPDQDETTDILLQMTDAPAQITDQASYEEELAKLGLVPGDQLTWVILTIDPSTPVATMTYGDSQTAQNYAQTVRYCRVVLAPTLPEDFVPSTLINGGEFAPGLVVESAGELPTLTTGVNDDVNVLRASFAVGELSIASAAIIRSHRTDAGKYQYSSSDMIVNREIITRDNAYPAYLSYTSLGVVVNVGDNLYLRNAVAAPFAQGE